MKRRRQALKLCLNTAVVVVIQVSNQFNFEVFQRIEFLQIQQLTLQQAKEVFHDSIIQTVTFAAHALPDAIVFQQLLVMFMLILSALI